VVDFLPVGDMPPPGPKPFFSLLDQTLSVQLGRQIGRPFWIDTVGAPTWSRSASSSTTP
jgi:two-component system osmolarity sensor histidine kinase EnvZ